MMKILFISRAYPPILGGIEMQNFGIGKALSEIAETKIIANRKGKKNLPFFLPVLVLKMFFLLPKFDAVLFGDGVLSPVGVFLKFFFPKKKFISIIHGLDITYAYKKSLMGRIYRMVNIPAHKNMDKLIMVGNETIKEALGMGIPQEKCVFIPNGLDFGEICANYSKKDLQRILQMDLGDRKVIFRGGRFVKHKGNEWFIRNVVPGLPENYVFVAAGAVVSNVTAGDENEFPNCEKAVRELGLEDRVKLLTNLSREDFKALFNASDLYVSPNIKVRGSMEGFGITVIEAGACGRVVVASDLEGLKDAIENGQNGFLVESGNAEVWILKIKELLEDDDFRKSFGEKARSFVRENFTWDKIAVKYVSEMEKIIHQEALIQPAIDER